MLFAGMALVQKGDFAAARAALETGQRMDPSSKSFQTWLKKCGDAPAAAAAAPSQLGQHDTQLQGLFSVHGDQVYPMVETVLDFCKRNTDFFDHNGPLAVDMIGEKMFPFLSRVIHSPFDVRAGCRCLSQEWQEGNRDPPRGGGALPSMGTFNVATASSLVARQRGNLAAEF